MANVVDELVVILSLDPTQFTEGQKRALESLKKTRDDTTSTAKEMEARGAQGAEFFGKITSAAVGLFAILAGANTLEQFLGKTVPQIANLGRIANLLGQSGPDLRAFQLWIEQTGGNAETSTASLLKLSQVLQNFKTGIAIPDPAFLLGLSMIGGKATDSALQIFDKFAAWTATHTGPEALQEGNRLGLDTDTINAAIRAGPNAQADLNQQLANAPNPAQIKRIQDLQTAFMKLRQAITGSAVAMTADFAPALTHIMNVLDGLEPATTRTDRDMQTLGRSAGALGKGWEALTKLLGQEGVWSFLSDVFHNFVGEINVIILMMRLMGDGIAVNAAAMTDLLAGKPGQALDLLKDGWSKIGGAAGRILSDYWNDRWSAANAPAGPPQQPAGPGQPSTGTAQVPSGRPIPPHVATSQAATIAMIRQKAIAAGLNPDYMVNLAYSESGLLTTGPSLFGYSAHTSKGWNYLDPSQNADHAIAEVKRDIALAKAQGHAYVPGDEKLAIFLGQGDFLRMLRSDPNAIARNLFPADAAANPTIFRDRTVAQVEALLRSLAVGGPRGSRGYTHTAQHVTIGAVHVHAPHVTDARGVAKHVRKELASQLANQANSALN